MLRRIVRLKSRIGGGGLFSQLVSDLQKVRHPVLGAQPIREGQTGRERVAGYENRCAPPLPEIVARTIGKRGCGRPDPLFWSALAGKRIARPATSHATFAESPTTYRGRGSSKARAGKVS